MRRLPNWTSHPGSLITCPTTELEELCGAARPALPPVSSAHTEAPGRTRSPAPLTRKNLVPAPLQLPPHLLHGPPSPGPGCGQDPPCKLHCAGSAVHLSPGPLMKDACGAREGLAGSPTRTRMQTCWTCVSESPRVPQCRDRARQGAAGCSWTLSIWSSCLALGPHTRLGFPLVGVGCK